MAQGSVYKRGLKWVIRYYDDTGKRRWKAIGTNKKEAERELRAIMGQVDNGTFREIKPISFSQYVSRWLAGLPAKELKPRTQDFYAEITKNHLLPFFGATQLTAIDRLMIKDFMAEKEKQGLAPKTRSHLLVGLATILNEAEDDGYLKLTPKIKGLAPKKERKQKKHLGEEGIQKFLA